MRARYSICRWASCGTGIISRYRYLSPSSRKAYAAHASCTPSTAHQAGRDARDSTKTIEYTVNTSMSGAHTGVTTC
jgi:hypothetical protein